MPRPLFFQSPVSPHRCFLEVLVHTWFFASFLKVFLMTFLRFFCCCFASEKVTFLDYNFNVFYACWNPLEWALAYTKTTFLGVCLSCFFLLFHSVFTSSLSRNLGEIYCKNRSEKRCFFLLKKPLLLGPFAQAFRWCKICGKSNTNYVKMAWIYTFLLLKFFYKNSINNQKKFWYKFEFYQFLPSFIIFCLFFPPTYFWVAS